MVVSARLRLGAFYDPERIRAVFGFRERQLFYTGTCRAYPVCRVAYGPLKTL